MEGIRIVLVALMCLPIISSAVPDSVITGPYNISFDLGLPKDGYKIDVKEPKSSETLGGEATEIYSFTLVPLNNTTASSLLYLVIHTGKQTVVPSAQRVSLSMRELVSLGFKEVDGAARQIDGKDGVVCSGLELRDGQMRTTYYADYYLSDDEKVLFYSGIPWDDGTLQLLKTIHVEKIDGD